MEFVFSSIITAEFLCLLSSQSNVTWVSLSQIRRRHTTITSHFHPMLMCSKYVYFQSQHIQRVSAFSAFVLTHIHTHTHTHTDATLYLRLVSRRMWCCVDNVSRQRIALMLKGEEGFFSCFKTSASRSSHWHNVTFQKKEILCCLSSTLRR